MMDPNRHDLTRIIFDALGHIDEWKLGDSDVAAAKGYPREYSFDVIDDYGMVFVDVVLDAETRQPICHEVNGPNGVGSDALTGESSDRARNEAHQVMRRLQERGYLKGARLDRPVVTIHAHQHWKAFRTGFEFYTRADDFATILADLLPGNLVNRRGANEPLGDEDLSVIIGDVPSVAAGIEVDLQTGQFSYKGRPVTFLGNPNLMPELIRIGQIPADRKWSEVVDLRVFHAWRLTRDIHNKSYQQKLFAGTGIRPMRNFEARSPEEALSLSCEHLTHGPVVLKPNGTSGGTGVHVVVPSMTKSEVRKKIDAVVEDCLAKYGTNADSALFPLRGFEFVRSTGYPMASGEHLWDLRIGVLFEPGMIRTFPVSIRVTPLPFDPDTFHLDRDQWVSNVSGRTSYCLLSGMDDKVLASIGMTPELLDTVFQASAKWTAKAWDMDVRGQNVYEDACEQDDPDFYPYNKFAA